MSDMSTATTTLDRMRCDHGMPSPASCVDCMDAGVFLPASARRAGAGQRTVTGSAYALRNDCTIQAIVNALGVDYLDAVEAMAATGWTPGTGATEAQQRAMYASFGFNLVATGMTFAEAERHGGTFLVRGHRGGRRNGHAWIIEAGRHINSNGWERPGRTRTQYRILAIEG